MSDGYKEFQRIMAELNYKIKNQGTNTSSMPPGFEELFKGFNK
jgi:hypothetical protein